MKVEEGHHGLTPSLLSQADVGRVRMYVYRESVCNSAIPQAGIVEVPTHVLEFSTSETVSDSRR